MHLHIPARRTGRSLPAAVLVAALALSPLVAAGAPPGSPARCEGAGCPPVGVTEGLVDSGPATVPTGPVGRAPDVTGPEAARRGEATEQGGATSTPAPLPGPRQRVDGYLRSSRALQPVPEGSRPYQDHAVRPVPFGLVDSSGVRMFRLDSDPTIWEHPVGQAQYALKALESYRMSGERRYLDVATANAQRLVDRAVDIDGAWYIPYDFDFDLYRNGRGVLTGPWSSGMTTGQALSTFVDMYQVTGEEKWRTAADRTFAAFLQAPDGRSFYTSFVDSSRMLWLEEYPRYPVTDSERVLNGHMWAMYGIWDYWQLNGYAHQDAEDLFRGALYTLEKTVMRDFRQPGWVSKYSIWQGRIAPTYHQYHQSQFLMLWRMTHDSVWISRAFTFREDYPEWRNTSGFAVVTPRVTTLYKLDDTHININVRSMKVLGTRSVSFTRVTGASYDRRGRIPGGPKVIRLSTGPHAGWWVPEGHGVSWSRTPVEMHTYAPTAEVSVATTRRVAVYRYDSLGNRAQHKFVTLNAGQTYRPRASAVVEGRPSWLLTGAGLDGWWLPHQSGLTVQRTPGWS